MAVFVLALSDEKAIKIDYATLMMWLFCILNGFENIGGYMMKNKALLGSVISIMAFLIGYFVHSQFFPKQPDIAKQHVNQKMPIKIGVLQLLSHDALDEIYRGFSEEMVRLGYQDGNNVSIQLLNAQGDQSQLATMSEKLNQESDILVGITTPSSISLAKTTQQKPIILSGVSYPVQSGLMNSEEVSGNNVTGVAHRTPIYEQFEVMLQVMPQLKKIGFIYTANEDNAVLQIEEAKAVAQKLGLVIELATITNTNDLQQATESLMGKVDALFLPVDNTIASAMPTIIQVSDKYHIPVFPSAETMVADGGVLSIGVEQYTIGVETAKVVDQIIKGVKPNQLPLVIPTGDTLYMNAKKMQEFHFSVPQGLHNKVKMINEE